MMLAKSVSKINKSILSVTIALTAIISGSTVALAGITTPASVFNDRLKTSDNYAWLGDSTTLYNCMAYAIQDYSQGWIWPWGVNNPTSAQMDTYMNSIGWYGVTMDSYDVALYEIISYGQSNSDISHVGRIADSTHSNAKWGPLELLQHSGWDPYKSSSPPNDVYGDARKKYYKGLK